MRSAYICSSLKLDNYNRTTEILEQLSDYALLLRPHPDEITKPIKKLDTVKMDIVLIEGADELWLLSKFGRDCSWELGFAAAKGKIIRVLVDNTNRAAIESDWMLHQHAKLYYSIPEFIASLVAVSEPKIFVEGRSYE